MSSGGRTQQDYTPILGTDDDGASGGTTRPSIDDSSATALRPPGTTSNGVLFPPDPPGIASSVAREALFALENSLEGIQRSVRPWLGAIPRRRRNGIVRTRVELAVGALRG